MSLLFKKESSFRTLCVCTGTNACYVETLSNIKKFKMHWLPRTQDMIVNIEWAGFRSSAFNITEEDVELDKDSHKPGEQCFEKLTSGLYMGEIARRILLRYLMYLLFWSCT